ncbi:MAG: hypothetical protein IT373_24755 [Polyangiaceae bacterium]|nr:hypothetical protein [Polyangiaceae bacterium]
MSCRATPHPELQGAFGLCLLASLAVACPQREPPPAPAAPTSATLAAPAAPTPTTATPTTATPTTATPTTATPTTATPTTTAGAATPAASVTPPAGTSAVLAGSAPAAEPSLAPPPRCPPGTCRRSPSGPCEPPTGQLGNACCGCGADGMCASPCRCAALDTPVETPSGPRAIGELAVGDLVYSLDHGARQAVPIVRVFRSPAAGAEIVRLRLASGAVLRMSPGHPTADGRTFAELATGDRLDGVAIVEALREPYDRDETADILPASDSGTYVAAGVLVGSTLRDLRP